MLLHFRGHEARKAKKAKEEQLALRRGASKVARDVRAFWGKLNKVTRSVRGSRAYGVGMYPNSIGGGCGRVVFFYMICCHRVLLVGTSDTTARWKTIPTHGSP